MAREIKAFKFKGLDGEEYKLTLKQKLFCEAYLDFKGNGVEAIYQAGYKPKNVRVAASMAYDNLIKPDIMAYVNVKLEEYGFNDKNVEKQHLFLLNQFGNLIAKKSAVDMFYKKRGDYAPQRHEVDVSDEVKEFFKVLSRDKQSPIKPESARYKEPVNS